MSSPDGLEVGTQDVRKATRRRYLLSLLAVPILGVVFTAGLLTGRVTRRPKAPDPADAQIWLPIKVFHGTLARDSGKVDATVSAIFRLSDDRYSHTVMQNKIEINTAERRFTFLWPDNETFAAGWCDILDVDGDGAKEFLLYAGVGSLRIVSFAGGEFQFRPDLDDLLSFEYAVGPFDLDDDGNLEFVEAEHFPSNLDTNTKWVWIPRVKRWSRVSGFIDVSKEYPRYYREQLIPDLERRLTTEQDQELQQTIAQALEFLKSDRF